MAPRPPPPRKPGISWRAVGFALCALVVLAFWGAALAMILQIFFGVPR